MIKNDQPFAAPAAADFFMRSGTVPQMSPQNSEIAKTAEAAKRLSTTFASRMNPTAPPAMTGSSIL